MLKLKIATMIAVKIISTIIITPPSMYLEIKGKAKIVNSAFKCFHNYSPTVIDCLTKLYKMIIQLDHSIVYFNCKCFSK